MSRCSTQSVSANQSGNSGIISVISQIGQLGFTWLEGGGKRVRKYNGF